MTIDTLVDMLHRGGYSCVIANGDEVRTFTRRGVMDLYMLLTCDVGFLRGAWVADKVVGKGAAALMVLGGVARLHADVLSDDAARVLSSAGVDFSCARSVQYIINRDGTGRCPVETLCAGTDAPEEMLPLIGRFVEDVLQRQGEAK